MKKTAYGKPLFLNENGDVIQLNKIEAYSEHSIQDLIFKHSECLPISDIDESYNPIVPICKELNTTVGPLDILMVSPNGELTIIETKLWRNPEARRKVVAQILDYAKEMSRWSYEDLQREVNRRLGTKGNALYDLLKDKKPDSLLPESDFIDSVSRNLERGKFLLLIAGDGIRDGANSITEFISNAGHLNFTFAMVELSIYESDELGKLIVPKTLVKTKEVSKITVEVPNGFKLTKDHIDTERNSYELRSPEKQKEREFYKYFWSDLIAELSFDDPGQPMPNLPNAQNLFLYPGKTKKAWISAYFMNSQNRVGVYFRVQNDQEGKEIVEALNEDKEAIKQELGNDVIWSSDQPDDFGVRLPCDDVFNSDNREEIKDFFKDWLNTFVNVIRPRMKRMNLN